MATAPYMRTVDNSLSSTVLDCFVRAASEFCVPSRVCFDHGGENILVGMFMLRYRGTNRGSLITGHSVHNQRIKRLWIDVFAGCTNVYYELFHYLEDVGLFNIENELQCFVCTMYFCQDLCELNIIVPPYSYIFKVFLLVIAVESKK